MIGYTVDTCSIFSVGKEKHLCRYGPVSNRPTHVRLKVGGRRKIRTTGKRHLSDTLIYTTGTDMSYSDRE